MNIKATYLILLLIKATTVISNETIIDKELLRGSEHRHDELNTNKSETIQKDDLNINNTEVNTKQEEDISVIEVRTTTDSPVTTEDAPEALGLKNDDIDELEDDSTTVVTTEKETEATSTLSMIDNDVFVANGTADNNIEHVTTKMSTPAPTPTPTLTTRAMDEIEAPVPSVVAFDDDQAMPGQRNPKTDHSDVVPDTQRVESKTVPPTEVKSPPATLKTWLEDTWLRPPPGILIPLRPMALNRALAVWNDLVSEGLNMTDIVIVGFDSNGVAWRSRHNLRPSRPGSTEKTVAAALSKLLLKYQGTKHDTDGDATMRAIVSASKLVPYDSALFLITDRQPADVDNTPRAVKALVQKRVKAYTIWTDPSYPSIDSERELAELRNISLLTEGEILPYATPVMDLNRSNMSPESWDEQRRQGRVNTIPEELDKLLVRRGGGEAISLGVPVENGVSALRVFIEGLVEHAVLYPPNDAPQIDLYNMTSVRAFSPTSRTDGMTPRDVYLVFPGANPEADMLSVIPMLPTSPPDYLAPTVGLWHLSIRCDTCDYRLVVTARSRIHFYTKIEKKDVIKVRVTGPVASIRESVLVDEYGTELAKLNFTYEPISVDGTSQSAPPELGREVSLPAVKGSKVYVKIVGRDLRGEAFVRLSGPIATPETRVRRSPETAEDANDLERAEAYAQANSKIERLEYNESTVLPYNRATSQVINQRGTLLTAVQIGLSTKLYGAPGAALQLHFEVTNYREQSVSFRFGAVGELNFLRAISPLSQTIASGQTVIVIVSLIITATAQPGARDLITFTAYGLEQVSISTYVYVTNPGEVVADVWSPELRHYFQGSCLGRQGSDCGQHSWSATVVARDRVGGLLRLTSSPTGLTYDSNFIAGSREEVIGVYRSTCCSPRVLVTAVDAYGNANSYIVDISNYFSEAGIAAIVLGVFLFIFIIIVVVLLIYWCVKRRQESRELPYSTSSRNVS